MQRPRDTDPPGSAEFTAPPGAVPASAPGGKETRKSDLWIFAGLAVWLAVISVAMVALWKYKSTPGPVGTSAAVWPAESRVRRASDLPTLVMFAHPKCACTRASLSELRVLMSRANGRVAARVLFLLPDGVNASWKDTDTWRTAASIPGVTVAADSEGCEAHRFGAATSGHIVLYDREGRLLFSGGITGARGHEGDNVGLDRALAGVTTGASERPRSSVFGCELEEHHE